MFEQVEAKAAGGRKGLFFLGSTAIEAALLAGILAFTAKRLVDPPVKEDIRVVVSWPARAGPPAQMPGATAHGGKRGSGSRATTATTSKPSFNAPLRPVDVPESAAP